MSGATIAIDRIFHALGDPTRRAMVDQLSRGPTTVSNLSKPLRITLAATLQHMEVLEKCGLARSAKVGRVRTCQIDIKGLSLAESWLSQRRDLWTRRYDRLGELLAEESARDPGH